MSKASTTQCIGYGRPGLLIACTSPLLPVGRGGRCSRCDQLHRRDTLAQSDPFPSINNTVLPGEPGYHAAPPAMRVMQPATPTTPIVVEPLAVETPEPELAAVVTEPAKSWHPQWPACLLCGRTKYPHGGKGTCRACSGKQAQLRSDGRGVTVVWLPFTHGDPSRYDPTKAQRWVTVRDLAETATYLERRASAGGIPTGGKVVIRATKHADQLPERVIRAVAA